MLRLATTRQTIAVVEDQLGSPTYAPDLARAILSLADGVLREPSASRWGIYHAVGSGETNWSGFAREVFRYAREKGLPAAEVDAIASSAYPTPARRPPNSRLNCEKLRLSFGLALPDWQLGVANCVSRLAASAQASDS
jgi:dTDP-4-dehydrorhamnose reductase